MKFKKGDEIGASGLIAIVGEIGERKGKKCYQLFFDKNENSGKFFEQNKVEAKFRLKRRF